MSRAIETVVRSRSWAADARDDDLAQLTRRAAQCGMAAQSTLHNYPASGRAVVPPRSCGVAERYFQFALGTAEGVDDRGCLGRVWFTKGYYLVGKAEWAAAQDALGRAYKTFEQLGDRRWCETTLLTLGNMNYNQGQYPRSLELYAEAYESGHRRAVTFKPKHGRWLRRPSSSSRWVTPTPRSIP